MPIHKNMPCVSTPTRKAGTQVIRIFLLFCSVILVPGCGSDTQPIQPSIVVDPVFPPISNPNPNPSPNTSALGILQQPSSITVPSGQAAAFNVAAKGGEDLRYQWLVNGIPIPGATSSSYVTPSLLTSSSGEQYSVVVSDVTGSVASTAATLTVSNIATAKLAEGVYLLSEAEESKIVSSSATEVRFSEPISFSVGTVVIGQSHAFRVLAVTASGTGTTLTVTEPTLKQMFANLTIQGFYIAAPENAMPTSARPAATPKAATEVSNSFAWDFSLEDGGFEAEATLSSAISAFVNYRFEDDSLAPAIAVLRISNKNKVELSVLTKKDAEASFEKNLGIVRIPIPVSVVDSALRLVGVRLVDIQIPVFAGISTTAEFQEQSSAVINAAGDISVSYTPASGPQAKSVFTASFVPNGLNPTAPSGAPALQTFTQEGSVFVRFEPALSFVQSVLLLGVETKLSLVDTAVLQILPNTNTPPFCFTNGIELLAQAHGFLKSADVAVLKTAEFNSPNLLPEMAPVYIGSCQARTVVNGSVSVPQPIPYRDAISVLATVALAPMSANVPESSPSGTVIITASGGRCEATLARVSMDAAAGSCSLTPLTSGAMTHLMLSYSGDDKYAPSTGTTTVDISRPPETLLGSPATVVVENPRGNEITKPATGRVGAGVEFSSGNLTTTSDRRIIGASLDVGADHIDLTYNQSATADTSSFNGYVFTFGSGSPSILGCSLNPVSTFSSGEARISCNSNQVVINVSGIMTNPGDRILIDLKLGAPVQ